MIHHHRGGEHGAEAALARMLKEDPSLISARSSRATSRNPPVHRATLLHYAAASGVESHRQLSPLNVVRIARIILGAGPDPNARADMY